MTATGQSIATAGRGYTLDSLLAILQEQELVTAEQAEDIRQREPALRTKVTRDRERAFAGFGRAVYEPSPAEVVAAYRVPLDDGTLTEDLVMEAFAMAAGYPYHKVDPLKLDAKLISSTLSRPFAQRHVVLPLRMANGRMTVAVDNPYSLELFDSLRAITGCEIDLVIASKTDILKTIREIYGFRSSVEQAAEDIGQSIDIGNFEQFVQLRNAEEIEATDAHIINAVEYLLNYAFEQRASDIHIEPKREHSVARLRIDGVLHTVHKMPKVIHPAICSRIKSLARMDIAEKRRPQDGRIKTGHDKREVELRISSMPVAFGEKMVIRIFDPRILLQELDGLGFYKKELALFHSFIRRPNGIVLVTGPTGSGKTTTLYSALKLLATPDVNVVTIEDPIEMVVEEFNQVAVQPKAGITFSSALRTILRQDPDIIMVGEIRDQETAENAIQAALTGHLVLSTLHTNDTAGAIARLRDLGIPSFLVASTVIGVIAQRLVRKVCRHCAQKSILSREQCMALQMPIPEGHDAPELPVMRGEGCVYCRHTGLRGRTGVYEVLPVNDRLRKLITDGAPTPEITKAAQLDGMMTLRECAIKKLAQGLTTFDEVIRVTSETV
ncbi:MAG: Flp pilus assembly complex ATPase component TadA [Myxococcales bacterium]|nr:Flp pilus assembly complex ATPase component TadA [Myxococcales bacterium]